MALNDNERMQEIGLVIGDSFRGRNKKWIYFQVFIFLVAFPMYFGVREAVYNVAMSAYHAPKVTELAERLPLEIIEQGFLKSGDNNYTPYVKLKNLNLDWGVPDLEYSADVKTLDGTMLSTVTGASFILPATDKYILLPRINSSKTPTSIDFSLLGSKFVLKPVTFPEVNIDVQRTQVGIVDGQTVLSAVLKNNSPFTIAQVDIPVILYNERTQIVGLNYTNINDLKSGELRSFQLTWPSILPGILRAEISPELNVFNKELLQTQGPVSPFDQ